jgi:hypothetical protein
LIGLIGVTDRFDLLFFTSFLAQFLQISSLRNAHEQAGEYYLHLLEKERKMPGKDAPSEMPQGFPPKQDKHAEVIRQKRDGIP